MAPWETGWPRRVVVADDDDDLRALVVATLRANDYEVIEARDGGELLEILERTTDASSRPDVIVTDVKMPLLSGLGVLSAMRRARLSIPVVVMTAYSHDSVRTVARRLGAVGVVHKPFDVDDLLTAVMNAPIAHARTRTFHRHL
jgi:CheY-like chemotaxis protein